MCVWTDASPPPIATALPLKCIILITIHRGMYPTDVVDTMDSRLSLEVSTYYLQGQFQLNGADFGSHLSHVRVLRELYEE